MNRDSARSISICVMMPTPLDPTRPLDGGLGVYQLQGISRSRVPGVCVDVHAYVMEGKPPAVGHTSFNGSVGSNARVVDRTAASIQSQAALSRSNVVSKGLLAVRTEPTRRTTGFDTRSMWFNFVAVSPAYPVRSSGGCCWTYETIWCQPTMSTGPPSHHIDRLDTSA